MSRYPTSSGGGSSFTAEDAQDAVGAMIADTATVDLTYTDATPELKADVIDDSITNAKLANMATTTIKGRVTAGTGDPEDLSATNARTVLGLATGDSPQFTAIELGHASDTTIARASAGNITVEGNAIYRAGGTDVAIADGGTNGSTATAGFDNLAPTTTRGDIIIRNASNNIRLAIGADGTFLASDGTDVSWGTPSSAGGAEAYYAATITPTAGSPNISAVNTGTDTVTITAHGLTTGNPYIALASSPAGITNGQCYYVNVVDANTVSFHLTLAAALAGTSKVDITGSGTGGTWRKLVATNEVTYGMSAVAPIAYNESTTSLGLTFNLSDTSVAKAMTQLQYSGITALSANDVSYVNKGAIPTPSSVSSGVIKWLNANLPIAVVGHDSVDGTNQKGTSLTLPVTIANQGTTAFTVSFLAFT